MIVFCVAKNQQFVQNLHRIIKKGAIGCPDDSCEKIQSTVVVQK